MPQEEKVPLLIPSEPQSPLYPAFVLPKGYSLPLPPYNATDNTGSYGLLMPAPDRRQRQPRGHISMSIGGALAIGLALVLLFGVVFISGTKHKYSPVVLRQSAAAGYKDITIPQGLLRGFTRKSRQGRDYTAYYKVPYAEPPLGQLRFKDPIAPQGGWDGLRAIPEVASQCIQKEKYSDIIHAVGVEDCLNANIYVPEVSHEDPLPVMVYIHGGGFVDGNGSRYGPDYFMDEDVIVITFQYRLGAFGFLNTGDNVIRGNMGFKDQVQMLKWTKDNIQYFGGDPQRVTIYGNSAGGMSVSFLMLSPMANGLFHRAITQSGAGICANLNSVFDTNPEDTLREVERELGCDAQNTTKFLECLRTKPAADVALVRTPKTKYGLTLEHRNDDQVFISDNPYNLAKTNPNRVPYIVGVVNAEWVALALGLLQDDRLVEQLNNDWSGTADKVLLEGVNMTKEELDSVKTFYFQEQPIGNETLRELISLASDRALIHCSYVSALLHGKYSPTYLYYVTKPPYKSYADKAQPGFPAKEMGLLSHADELQFLFLYEGYPEIKAGDEEYFEFSKLMVNSWATFARDGEPQQEWRRATTGQGENDKDIFWYELNDKPGRTEVIKENMEFWDGFTHDQLGYAG